jgi:calcineurin-like phosphoesterase family protein
MSNTTVTRTPTIFFTSDLHFGHDKDFIWKDRGFNSVEEMNNAIVKRWNDIVEPEDTVFVLGDLMMGDSSNVEWIKKLNGDLEIIAGNHDTVKRLEEYCKLPNIVYHGYAFLLKKGKRNFYLSHYPTITKNGDAPGIPWNLHGHTHSKERFCEFDHCYNVNIDAHHCTPVSIDQIIYDINEHEQKKEKKKELKWYQKLLYKGEKGLC